MSQAAAGAHDFESTDLVLPGAISETALDLPESLAFEEWERVGQTLGRIERACQWWIGDWLRYGERRYGDKYAQAIEATGYEYDTLNSFRWVAQAIEPVRRRTNLKWSHHKEVVALETATEQDAWLDHAERERLTVRALREEIRQARPVRTPRVAGAREISQQEQLVAGLVERARHIEDLTPHLDLDVVRQVPEERKLEWERQLRSTRTVLSRLLAAL